MKKLSIVIVVLSIVSIAYAESLPVKLQINQDGKRIGDGCVNLFLSYDDGVNPPTLPSSHLVIDGEAIVSLDTDKLSYTLILQTSTECDFDLKRIVRDLRTLSNIKK